MKEYIQKVASKQNLTQEEASVAMRIIMEGNASPAQIAGFLMALKLKEEHPDELFGFVQVMREKSVKVVVNDPNAIDMCGTGGDGTGTFNISTVASFVVAGAGVTVAKHGNRSVSSSCGSADVLKELGVNFELSAEDISKCIQTAGIGFLFAPLFHPAMKHAAAPRSELGVKTAFNLLGPMTNPAGVRRQLVGAYNADVAKKMAQVFSNLESEKVYIVSSHDGLDEISLQAPTTVFEVTQGNPVKQYEVTPESFGLPRTELSSILGGTAETNASITTRILNGERIPPRNYVIANSAFGLMVAGKARSVKEGVAIAEESIDSGKALAKLNELKAFRNP